VPDWEADEPVTTVAEPPAIAPPPGSPPPAPGPASTNTHFTETWVPLERWCKSNGLSAPVRLTLSRAAAYEIKTVKSSFILHPGSQVGYCDGLEVRLGFAPQMINNQAFVHHLDLEKTVEPLLASPPLALLRTNPIIVIDPGHGGENAGTKSVLGERYEKEFTLDWALRLERLLATNGWQVFLTRSNDSNPSIPTRVAFAQEHCADLFLSLHFNSAAPAEGQAGLETYCLTPAGLPSTLTRGYGDDPGVVFPNNAFDAQNLQFALQVHRALLQVNSARDRGIRHARFPGVLRGQQRPAILIEGGYLSNPVEARRIAEPAYRQKLAEAVAQALEGFKD